MSQVEDERIWAAIERRLAAVEPLIGDPLPWRSTTEAEVGRDRIRVVPGTAFRGAGARRRRPDRFMLFALLLVSALLAALVFAGIAGHRAPRITMVHGFSAVGPTVRERSASAVVPLPDDLALVIGGDATADTAELYDPVSGTFALTGSIPSPAGFGSITNDSATPLRDGRVLVLDSRNGAAAVFDPVTATFSLGGTLSVPRMGAATAVLPNGRVLVVGGEPPPWVGPPYATAELFDPATGRFSATGSLAASRSAATATSLTDGRVLVTAGEGDAGRAELYDATTGTFAPTGSMTTGRRQFATAALRDGRVLVLGGLLTPSPTDADELLASVEVFDPTTGQFSSAGQLLLARRAASATTLADGRVLVTGGFDMDGTGTPVQSELFDPSTGHSTLVADSSLVPLTVQARLMDGDVLVLSGDGTTHIFHP